MTKASRLSAPRKQRTTTSRSSAPQPSLAPSSSTADLLSPDVDFGNEDPASDDLLYSPGKSATRSSSITPPPVIPLARNDKRSRATGDSDFDAVNEKPKKKSRKTVAEVVEPEDHRLVLMIPRAELDGSQCVLLSHATTFDEALSVIYETIGCANVTVKPVLTYKLSNATKSTEVICLSSVDDWDGCLEQVAAAENPNKPISVKINVTDQYLASLRAKLKIKVSGTSTRTARGKTKMQILDLEHAGSGDDDFDEGIGLMDKERKRLAELQAKYNRYQLCGPDKACKIDINGSHCKLSNNQLRAWSAALALETLGVTLATPPNDALFGMFFKNSKSIPASLMVQASFPFPPYMPMNPMNPYGIMPWSMPSMPSFWIPASPVTPTPNLHVAHASGSNRRSPPISLSDPPDMTAANVYPEITSFLRKLDEFHPKRDLLKYIPLFEELDFFNIDEIAKLETATALRGAMDISLGNATFLLEQVRGEMKRTDRERRALGAAA